MAPCISICCSLTITTETHLTGTTKENTSRLSHDTKSLKVFSSLVLIPTQRWFCRAQRPKLLPPPNQIKKQQSDPPLLWDAEKITYSCQLFQSCLWRVQPFLDTAAALVLLSITSCFPSPRTDLLTPKALGCSKSMLSITQKANKKWGILSRPALLCQLRG